MSAEIHRVFVDTNILVYAFDTADLGKQVRANEVIKELATNGRIVVSGQVLSEFFVTVTRKLATPLQVDVALDALDDLSRLSVVALDADLVTSAAHRSKRDQMSHWDALIVEAAARSGCRTILSEDLQDGRDYDGIVVNNPFRESS